MANRSVGGPGVVCLIEEKAGVLVVGMRRG